MKIVLDTNVIISGLLFPGGAPDKIVRAVLTGAFQNATSPDLLTELKKVLQKKFSLSEVKLNGFVELVRSASELVYPPERLNVIKADEPDNRILECAIAAEANIIITGDTKHLLPLKAYKGIVIQSPGDFVEKSPLV